jgi:ABC-type uncharacterized transport system substrate-binding protein
MRSYIYIGMQETQGLYHIGIVQIVEAALLDDARRGVMDALWDEGFTDGINTRISFKRANGDLRNIPIMSLSRLLLNHSFLFQMSDVIHRITQF